MEETETVETTEDNTDLKVENITHKLSIEFSETSDKTVNASIKFSDGMTMSDYVNAIAVQILSLNEKSGAEITLKETMLVVLDTVKALGEIKKGDD